jgi:hypothetical protein
MSTERPRWRVDVPTLVMWGLLGSGCWALLILLLMVLTT